MIENSFCVADFEFSSNDGEILEIGAVKVENDNIIDSFHCFVKQRGNKLTNLDKKITKLNDIDLKEGLSIEVALNNFYSFCKNRIIYTWSNSDKKVVDENIKKNDLNLSFEFHDGREEIFNKYTKMKRNLSVEDAINWIGECFKGNKHTALDDAINTATILIKIKEITSR